MNWKPILVYSLLFIAVIALVVVIAIASGKRKKPIDWRQSYHVKHKKPYGLYIFNDILPKLLPNSKIIPSASSVNDNLELLKNQASVSRKRNLQLVIITGFFNPDSFETQQILYTVAEEGVHLFLASYLFNQKFLDEIAPNTSIHTSGIINPYSDSPNDDLIRIDSTIQYQLVDTLFHAEKPIRLKKAGLRSSIELAADQPFQILGIDDSNQVNFVAIPYGKGVVYLHTNPLIFSNYNWLQPAGATYATNVCRYLEDSSVVVLDQYFSQKKPNKEDDSPGLLANLSFILAQPALRMALLLIVAGLLIYFFFTAKRKQRIVPLIAIEQNTTMDFTAVLASLYLKSKPHKTIARKLINHWLDNVRQKLHIEYTGWSIEFCNKVHDKSGAPLTCIESIMGAAQLIEEPIEFTASDLQSLHAEIKTYFDAVQNYDKSPQF